MNYIFTAIDCMIVKKNISYTKFKPKIIVEPIHITLVKK